MWATPPEQAVVPPCTGAFSQTTTDAPPPSAPAAAERAAAPLPTTTTSHSSGATLRGRRGEGSTPGRWGSSARSATRSPSDGWRTGAVIVGVSPEVPMTCSFVSLIVIASPVHSENGDSGWPRWPARAGADRGNMGLTIDDQLAIQQLAARYNHAIDSGDSTAFAGAFVEDGVLDAGELVVEGHAALEQFGKSFHRSTRAPRSRGHQPGGRRPRRRGHAPGLRPDVRARWATRRTRRSLRRASTPTPCRRWTGTGSSCDERSPGTREPDRINGHDDFAAQIDFSP